MLTTRYVKVVRGTNCSGDGVFSVRLEPHSYLDDHKAVSRSTSSRGPDNIIDRRWIIWKSPPSPWFSCVPPVNSEVARQIRPWSVACTSLPVRYSLIIATIGGGTTRSVQGPGCGLDISGFVSRLCQGIFLVTRTSRQALGPT